MLDLLDDLKIDLLAPGLRGGSFRQSLKSVLADFPPQGNTDASYIYEHLMEKEQTRSSAMGGGLAMPHLQSDDIVQPFAALALFEKPLIYAAPDNIPINMLCVVLSPAGTGPRHLRRLSRLARFLKNPDTQTQLRESNDPGLALKVMLAAATTTLAA